MNQDQPIFIPDSPAIDRFLDTLEKAGMDEQSMAFLLGRISREVLNAAIIKAGIEIGAESLQSLGSIQNEEQKAVALYNLYEQKTGKKFNDLANECAEMIVQDFEKA